MDPYEAFLSSLDIKDNWEITELELAERTIYKYALANFSLWDDKAPVLKNFRRKPNRAPLKLDSGKYRIIINNHSNERYYFDSEVEAWYEF